MKKRLQFICLLMIILITSTLISFAQDLKPIQLPEPNMSGGKPLLEVLKNRKTTRVFSSQDLPLQQLSDLLWAAFGINRENSGRRTAPSAYNWQEIDIYIANSRGLYLYDAKTLTLHPVLAGDIREKTGFPPFIKVAPVNLIYVADYSKMKNNPPDEIKDLFSAADAGFIAQNVYLFCASEGLAVVVRGSIDRPVLADAMKLRSHQKIILAQTIGYPMK